MSAWTTAQWNKWPKMSNDFIKVSLKACMRPFRLLRSAPLSHRVTSLPRHFPSFSYNCFVVSRLVHPIDLLIHHSSVHLLMRQSVFPLFVLLPPVLPLPFLPPFPLPPFPLPPFPLPLFTLPLLIPLLLPLPLFLFHLSYLPPSLPPSLLLFPPLPLSPFPLFLIFFFYSSSSSSPSSSSFPSFFFSYFSLIDHYTRDNHLHRVDKFSEFRKK